MGLRAFARETCGERAVAAHRERCVIGHAVETRTYAAVSRGAPPPPHPHLYKFVDLDLTLAELSPTRRGPVLEFGGHNLGHKGLATLLSSRNLRYIVRLDLQANNITAAGMAAFRASSFILNIADLNLSDNPIGDEGLKHLLDSAALLALDSLDLSNTELTDAGAQRLVDHEYIKFQRLYLGDTLLDIATWLRLADRYGEGLYARGVFRAPYKPPFDPRLLVCFSSSTDSCLAAHC